MGDGGGRTSQGLYRAHTMVVLHVQWYMKQACSGTPVAAANPRQCISSVPYAYRAYAAKSGVWPPAFR